MNGFLVKRYLSENIVEQPLAQAKEQFYLLGQYYYEICATQCQLIVRNNTLLLVDGYLIADDIERLFTLLSQQKFTQLATFEGHFSGLYINENEIITFNDRFGGKTLYWQYYQQQLFIASRFINMPVFDKTFNQQGTWEVLQYRWLTGENTLLDTIKKLPAHHHAIIQGDSQPRLISYWQLPAPDHKQAPLASKVAQCKTILQANLQKAATQHKKVAIFLSGGVDSSILAALAKDIFTECYLITPVFKGLANPELDTAISFAKTLGLPHQLVEVDQENLLTDLMHLIAVKKSPLRHYSSLAMMAMMRAIPEDYDAVLYGEAADTLFGSNAIKRILTHYQWKRQTQYIPRLLLKLFAKLVPGRGNILVNLKNTSLRELILSVTAIKYSSAEQDFIATLSNLPKTELTSWLWDKPLAAVTKASLRQVAQERILNSDAATHFYEAELIAQFYKKQIISPFFDPQLIELSASLTDQQYFGSDYVKPVLRELACQFFPRPLIYQKKHGFPVPFIQWLAVPFAALVQEVRNERHLFDGAQLENFTVKENFELFWLLINWLLVHRCIDQEEIGDVK